MKNIFKKLVLPTATFLAAAIVAPAQAATVTFDLDTVFSDGAVAPPGPTPYATITLDDGGGTGSVIMTIDVTTTVGEADLTALYLNFDSSLDLALLEFTYNGTTGPEANSISTGVNAFQSDGGGKYDILFDLPPPPGSDKLTAGEIVIYTITSTDAITANSFNFLSDEGSGEGTFLAASKWQGTVGENDSAWVGVSPVPVPATAWLFGSGLLGMVGIARRKKV